MTKAARFWLKQSKKGSGASLKGEQNSESLENRCFEGNGNVTTKVQEKSNGR